MSVKGLIACGPRCFRCLLDMPSGPVEEVLVVARIASVTIAGVKGRDRSVLVLVHVLCRRRSMYLSWGRVGNLLVEA